jgi:hypothetical protein
MKHGAEVLAEPLRPHLRLDKTPERVSKSVPTNVFLNANAYCSLLDVVAHDG